MFVNGRKDEPLKTGLVIEVDRDPQPVLLRITHVFDQTIYVMPVSTPNMARLAVRPSAKRRSDVIRNLKAGTWRIGRVPLPQAFLDSSSADRSIRATIDGAFSIIKPLVEQFDNEVKLARSTFTVLINRRAEELQISPVSLRRLLLRYYYFGRVKNALLRLRPGHPIGMQRPSSNCGGSETSPNLPTPKRRGRQPVEAETLGLNTFVVTDEDVMDMTDCLEALAEKGRTTQTAAHQKYMELYFSVRHSEKYAAYLAKKCPLPVTLRQFRDITSSNVVLKRDVIENVAGQSRKAAKGSLLATGPGEVYEIDATGGRIFLVDSKDQNKIIGTPIIYLIIDRWSRFIVSVYVTLRPPSWEEIRFALLIAFTSRKRRFTNLGLNIDEDRWPRGKVCARLVVDRGSEMISGAMLDAAVDGLRIETETLPPLCPDGKGVIERVNRELKRKMAQRGIKGVFADRPEDPKTKRAFKAAKGAGIHTLRELYWALIDMTDSHNNSSHSNLEKRAILKRAGVRPTPRDAYLWGLENITGIASPPLEEADYQRLLLGTDKASLANSALTYRGRRYVPMNAAAERQAHLSTSRRRAVDIKVDYSDPVELYAPNGDHEWPLWHVDAAGLQELQEITLEEEDHLAKNHRLLVAITRNDTFVENQQRSPIPFRKPSGENTSTAKTTAVDATLRRMAETTKIKRALIGKPNVSPAASCAGH
ncbi:hypothetical protein ACHAC9_24040 [Massilia sp. CMS3.1]|uniref:hypothetical protein n=1 Tax=Massilia sp. CMS3.1 TaxID=3373083 RepID=UPI003EE5C3AE